MLINNEMANSALDYIRESYTLLEESLKELLNTPEDIFSRQPVNDFLKALDNRILYCKANYDLTPEDSDSLNTLKHDITNTIFNKFGGEFDITHEALEREYTTDIERYDVASVVFNNLYTNRKQFVSQFLVNYVFNNRKDYVKRYRTNENRKDLEYYSMRKEFSFANNDYYFIILNYIDILSDIIDCGDQFRFEEFCTLSEMDVDEASILYELLNKEETCPTEVILNSLKNSPFYNDMLIELKTSLINQFSLTK